MPMGDMEKTEHVKILEKWMKSYKPEDLFDKTGRLKPELTEMPPKGDRRMSANPHANGGLLLKICVCPIMRIMPSKSPSPARRRQNPPVTWESSCATP